MLARKMKLNQHKGVWKKTATKKLVERVSSDKYGEDIILE